MRVKRRAKVKQSLRPGEAEDEKMECKEPKMLISSFGLIMPLSPGGKLGIFMVQNIV